jgi:hypothetical protein
LKAEKKLWLDIKKNCTHIRWNNLQFSGVDGIPDLFGYHNTCGFFTVELKVSKGNKIRLSPMQIQFHHLHPDVSWILVRVDDQSLPKLFPGSAVRDLVRLGPCELAALSPDSWPELERLLVRLQPDEELTPP